MGGKDRTASQPVRIGRPRFHNVVVHERHQHSACELSEPLVPMRGEHVRPVRRCCLAVALTVLLGGCVRAASSIDDHGPAPVFELQVTASRPCPTAADPQLACFAVEMRNAGDKAGKGRCVVYHYMRDSETEVGEGPSFEARLRPGEVLRAQGQAHLTVPFGWLGFNSTNCNPGYRL
jgi:hypothetical protein